MTTAKESTPDVLREAMAAYAAEMAMQAELRDSLADVPDAREYAYRMPAHLVEALMCAERRGTILVLPNQTIANRLKPLGLVDCGTLSRALTAFGMAVWKVLREEES